MSSGKLPDGARFATRAVHAGLRPDPHFGSVVPAIHQTSTFVQPEPGEYVEDYDYARTANPTRRALEEALGELEGGHATAFASGLAAENALITAVCEAGSHVVLPRDLYGGTYRLVDKVLARWGLEYDLVDQTDLDALAAAIRPETRLVWVESPTNPRLDVVDIAGVVARSGDALVAVDNTFATPVNQRPLEQGADFVVHSLTKYLGGHSDTVAGAVIAADPEWGERAALRPERGRRDSRAARLLPRPPRPAHAAPADGGARRERARGRRVPARSAGRERRRAGPATRAWSRSATPTRARSAPARRSSRSPSRSAASSR